MHSAQLLTAIAAIGITAANAASTCTKDIKITQPTPVIDCEVIDADVTVEDVSGELSINGPKQIKGDFIVNNATNLFSISSSTINSIGGKFQLDSLEKLDNLQMTALRNVGELTLKKVPQLSKLNFGTSGFKARSISITDTRISDLSGLSVATVETFEIISNGQMTTFNSDLVNVTDRFLIRNKNVDMDITLEKLEYAGSIEISNAQSFKAPRLSQVKNAITFSENRGLKSFSAPNVTKIGATVAFQNNPNLANITFPKLKSIGGGLVIQNNTKLTEIRGFPKLEVTGDLNLFGDFEEVVLPALDNVKGAVNVQSTTDISDFCKPFDDLEKNNKIQGSKKCKSNNKKANEGKDGGESKTGSSKSGNSNKDDEGAAGIVNVNTAFLGLALVAGLAQLL